MSKQLLYGCLFVLCFLSVSFLSCKKHPDAGNNSFPGNSFSIPAPTPVNGSVSGRVVDENNAPVSSAAIEFAGIHTLTDPNGFFTINNATLDKYISTVTVLKPGYFNGYRSFCANPTMNIVHIKLLPKILTGTINSFSGGTVTLANATEINFQQNSMVFKNGGAVYNGTVNVYASYIDPTAADIDATVPGSFLGRDANNLYALQSTGMLAVDIESPSGEPLQLAANLPAAIKLPIPASLVNNAPANIDTWSLNEQGIWVKENIAAKNGDHYEFAAAHFSFWNCDIPNSVIYLSMHVQDQNGNAMPNAYMVLSAPVNSNAAIWGSAHGTTDILGNASGLVPAAVELTVSIAPGAYGCATPLGAQTIGPFNAAASLTVTEALAAQEVLSISGTANDCNNQPIQDGYALIYDANIYTYAPISNGSYSGSIIHCGAITSLNAHLKDNNGPGEAYVSPIAVTGNAVAIPLATLCGTPLNSFDGIYEVTGTFQDFSNSSFTGIYPKQYYLISLSPTTAAVAVQLNGSIDPAYSFYNGTGSSFYGNFGIQISVDGSLISELHNYYGDPANWPTQVGSPTMGTGAPQYQSGPPSIRWATLDPTGLNDYDPVARVMHVKYFMYQSTFTTGPRASFDETWTYIGPR